MGRRSRPREVAPLPAESEPPVRASETCPLCDRAIPPGARASRHHLTPKLKGGTHGETVRLHQVCHSAIHARYSEAEIARRLSDVDSLRQDPELARFVAWVRTKPPDFHARTRLAGDRRGARRER